MERKGYSQHQRKPTKRDREIGMQLAIARKQVDMSQEEVASELDLSWQQVGRYEKGGRIVASRLEQFSKILKKPITFFFERPNAKT
jgi:transcriptional regulator with XRE-family HTH domain